MAEAGGAHVTPIPTAHRDKSVSHPRNFDGSKTYSSVNDENTCGYASKPSSPVGSSGRGGGRLGQVLLGHGVSRRGVVKRRAEVEGVDESTASCLVKAFPSHGCDCTAMYLE